MASTSGKNHSFHTLARENQFRKPSTRGVDIPILNEFVTPHVESFNALFDDSGLPNGDGIGNGLLSLAMAEIDKKVVFDAKDGSGNRLSSVFFPGLKKSVFFNMMPFPKLALNKSP